MRCLPYCILRDREAMPGRAPQGLGGDVVSLVSEGGLAAAYGTAPDQYAPPTVGRLRAFARVVAAFHRMCTVLPVRYGSIVPSRAALAELLHERHRDFHALLDELEGCDEMGLYVLLRAADSTAAALPEEHPALRNGRTPQPGGASGTQYLSSRRACYAGRERLCQGVASAAETVQRAFEGLFVKCNVGDSVASAGRLLSLHFLIRREDGEQFLDAFRRLQARGREQVLLTGPWPPYNFAAPAQPGRATCNAPCAGGNGGA